MTMFMPGLGPLPDDYSPLSVFVPPVPARHDGVLFFYIRENSRIGIATTIERLIDLLDSMEADPDYEDVGDKEPALGWTEHGPDVLSEVYPHVSCGDLEQDSADQEPTLGAPEQHPEGERWTFHNQDYWAQGDRQFKSDECEEENEHGGDINDEPHGDRYEDDEDGGDCEADPAEAGIADADALWQLGLEAGGEYGCGAL